MKPPKAACRINWKSNKLVHLLRGVNLLYVSRFMRLLSAGVVLSAAFIAVNAQAPVPNVTTLYEGAKLVNSNGSAPIDNSAFIVQSGRFTQIGRRGELPLPRGGRRVDLTGKTVIPAFIDAHAHLGYMKDLTIGPQNYTQENLLDHLQRYAYHGVALGSTWGSDFGDMPFLVQSKVFPNAARFVSLGRGITTPGEGTAENMRQAAHVCATEDDCRIAVRENASRKLRLVKIWVQDRPAGIPKMAPELYRATVDEAHKHKMKVVVHATALPDVKDLLRAGIDGFAHIPTEVDDELMSMLKERPDVFFTPTLGTSRRLIHSPWLDSPDPLILDTVTPAQLKRLKERVAAQTPDAIERGRQNWERTRGVMRRLIDGGARIALGSDAGGMSGDQFVGWTVHTEIENMVAAGMTPAQALIACTRVPADVHGLDDMGTVAGGNSADFVVLDGDPLADITNTRKISRVFLRGQEVDRAALKAKWTRR
jgi:imidazolonepropionase-like amidohydrolase